MHVVLSLSRQTGPAECQQLCLQICSNNILGQLQLDDVWFCLLRHATKSANSPDDSRLHYDDFCQVGATADLNGQLGLFS